MKKEKLIAKRTEQKMSQSKIAHLINMEQSTYSRRESGDTKISKQEWEKIAEVLDCKIEDIYEPDEYFTIEMYSKNIGSHDNSSGNNNHYYNIPVTVLENLQDFIQHLKEENQTLKDEIKQYKSSL